MLERSLSLSVSLSLALSHACKRTGTDLPSPALPLPRPKPASPSTRASAASYSARESARRSTSYASFACWKRAAASGAAAPAAPLSGCVSSATARKAGRTSSGVASRATPSTA